MFFHLIFKWKNRYHLTVYEKWWLHGKDNARLDNDLREDSEMRFNKTKGMKRGNIQSAIEEAITCGYKKRQMKLCHTLTLKSNDYNHTISL